MTPSRIQHNQRACASIDLLLATVIAAIIVLHSQTALAIGPPNRLTADDGGPNKWFGASVSISADKTIVGMPRDNTAGSWSGAAYIFQDLGGANWTQIAKLTPKDLAAFDQFGYSVSIDGNTAVVGAHEHEFGVAYVFEDDGAGQWTEVAELAPADIFFNDQFGSSVFVQGDRLLAGAQHDTTPAALYTGSAYIFERDGSGLWHETAKLIPSQGIYGEAFGASVAFSGETAIIGAPQRGSYAGAAYIFERDATGSWNEIANFYPTDWIGSNRFGTSVAISGDFAVVGANGNSSTAPSAGAAYVFHRDSTGIWSQVAKLTAGDAMTGAFFGSSVAIEDDLIAVGADGVYIDGQSGAGAVYLFEKSGFDNWRQIAKFTAADAAVGDDLGGSVAISQGTVIGGANYDDTEKGFDSGSVYVFRIPEPTSGTLVSLAGCLLGIVRRPARRPTTHAPWLAPERNQSRSNIAIVRKCPRPSWT